MPQAAILPIALGASAIGGVASSIIGGNAAKSAANQQAAAANQAAQLQMQQYQQTRQDLLPYMQAGETNLPLYTNFYKTSADQLGQVFSDLYNHVPQPMTEANLVQTPGYQFNLQQGLRAIQNSNAAQGLGVSGAALTAAGKYATGLADSTYQNQFNNQQQIYNDYANNFNSKLNQLNAVYGQIGAPITTGENAAAKSGEIGQAGAAAAGNNLLQAGVAQSAGTTGAAQAMENGIGTLTNAPLQYLAIQNALQSNSANGVNGGLGGLY